MPDLSDKPSQYFSWKELLYLPSWQVFHSPSESEVQNLTKLALCMDKVREYLEQPINVLCAIRPIYVIAPGTQWNGKNYNAAVGGAPHSAHIQGLAMDFTVSQINCEEVRHLLLDKLEEWGMRMENKAGSGWVHLDLYPPNPNRFFKP